MLCLLIFLLVKTSHPEPQNASGKQRHNLKCQTDTMAFEVARRVRIDVRCHYRKALANHLSDGPSNRPLGKSSNVNPCPSADNGESREDSSGYKTSAKHLDFVIGYQHQNNVTHNADDMAKHRKWRFHVQAIGRSVEDEESDESTRVRDDGKKLRLNLKTISEYSFRATIKNKKNLTRRVVKVINKGW